jgi:hypothetical protein
VRDPFDTEKGTQAGNEGLGDGRRMWPWRTIELVDARVHLRGAKLGRAVPVFVRLPVPLITLVRAVERSLPVCIAARLLVSVELCPYWGTGCSVLSLGSCSPLSCNPKMQAYDVTLEIAAYRHPQRVPLARGRSPDTDSTRTAWCCTSQPTRFRRSPCAALMCAAAAARPTLARKWPHARLGMDTNARGGAAAEAAVLLVDRHAKRDLAAPLSRRGFPWSAPSPLSLSCRRCRRRRRRPVGAPSVRDPNSCQREGGGGHVLVRVLAGVAHGFIVLGSRTTPKVLPRRRLLVLCLVLLLGS